MPPKKVSLTTDLIDEDWDTLTEYEKDEAVSDFLSNRFGFCHYGFLYEEIDGVVYITNIEWDTEE